MYETLSITQQYISLFALAFAGVFVWWWLNRLVNWSIGFSTRKFLGVIKKDPIASAIVLVGKWAVLAALVMAGMGRFVG